MYDEIATAIRNASHDGNKIAMFHFQVLRNASKLSGVDAVTFCRAVGMKESFATEFRKMIALAKVIEEQGYTLK